MDRLWQRPLRDCPCRCPRFRLVGPEPTASPRTLATPLSPLRSSTSSTRSCSPPIAFSHGLQRLFPPLLIPPCLGRFGPLCHKTILSDHSSAANRKKPDFGSV